LQAQHTLEIGPAVGIYLPLRNFAGPVTIPLPATVTGVWSQRNAVALGVSGRLWFSRRFGLQGSYQVASSGIAKKTSLGATRTAAGTIHVVTLEAQATIGTPSRPPQVALTGGLGCILRRGEPFRPFGSPNTLGAVLGLRADFPLVTRLRFAFRTGVLVYRFGLRNSDTEYKPSTQVDILGEAVLTYGLF
jgi:hypothetical protein